MKHTNHELGQFDFASPVSQLFAVLLLALDPHPLARSAAPAPALGGTPPTPALLPGGAALSKKTTGKKLAPVHAGKKTAASFGRDDAGAGPVAEIRCGDFGGRG